MKRASLSKSFSGTIRKATANDLSEIMKVERSCFDQSQAYEPEDMDEYLQKHLANPKTTPLIMAFAAAAGRKNPEIAGYGLGDIEENGHGTVVSIAVKKRFRGQKLGRKLLEQVCASLKRAGASQIDLEVETSNAAAIHIYETTGFVKERLLRDYYGEKRHAHLMVRRFKPD